MSARLPSRHPLIWFWAMPAIIVLFGLWAWGCRADDKDLEKDFTAETGHTWKEYENP